MESRHPQGGRSMTTAKKLMTGEEFEKLPDDGKRYELLDGELHEMAPDNELHNDIRTLIGWALAEYVIPRKLGRVLSGDTGYYLRRNPDRLRGPDLAFKSAERVQATGLSRRGFSDVLPDMVIEI